MAISLRQREILEMAAVSGKVAVDDLASHFAVTAQTIRRDLSDLCELGKLERVHGGAVLSSGAHNIAYEARRTLNRLSKDRIARACAERIADATSLFLSIGTTTENVARALSGHRDLLIVTNNINVANILMGNESCQIVVTGGVVRPSDGGLVGDASVDLMRQFKVDAAIVGTSAIDHDGDLLDYDFREVRVSQVAMEQARRRYLVADASKFQRGAPVRLGSLERFDCFFTDAPPPGPVADLCASWSTEVVVSPGSEGA